MKTFPELIRAVVCLFLDHKWKLLVFNKFCKRCGSVREITPKDRETLEKS